jgi:hypothetical protein
MLHVSFGIGTFTINHHFSQFKNISYNMRFYYDCFVTWDRKTSTFLQDIQKQTWRFYALVQSCENWVFYVRFVVLVCGKISELNVFSFYNYYKSNLKKLSTPWNLTEASEFGIFKNILFFFNTAYFFYMTS